MDRGRTLKCLRCSADMKNAGRETIQLGQTGWLLGDLPNLLAGGLDVEIWCCPSCGGQHDFDYLKCPYCGYNYYA